MFLTKIYTQHICMVHKYTKNDFVQRACLGLFSFFLRTLMCIPFFCLSTVDFLFSNILLSIQAHNSCLTIINFRWKFPFFVWILHFIMFYFMQRSPIIFNFADSITLLLYITVCIAICNSLRVKVKNKNFFDCIPLWKP